MAQLADRLVDILALHFARQEFHIVPPRMQGRFRIGLPKMHGRFRIGLPKVHGQFCMDPSKWYKRFRKVPRYSPYPPYPPTQAAPNIFPQLGNCSVP